MRPPRQGHTEGRGLAVGCPLLLLWQMLEAVKAWRTCLSWLMISTPAADAQRLWKPAWQAGQRAFVMAYFTREGLGLLTRILTLLRGGKLQDLFSWKLLSGDRGLVRSALPHYGW